ncbi:hypothetical protein JHK85_028289 [Glycine max]|nr:hypothetical protein JHK87_027527 [Glycine soja]KAG4996850.1 hypothetical protein JHK85_028289 [Glycine max]
MDNHQHGNHSDPAQARIKKKGIRQHKVNYQAQNIDCSASVSSPENQNYMSSVNEAAINREALQLDDKTLQNLVLLEIEQLLQANQRSLRDYPSMSYPEDANCPTYLDNSLILA